MADYYPLISRAVAGLEKNSGENRRALYERARAALLAQLRGVTPALNESDITRERLALEESIRKVEAESARQFAEPTRQPPAPRIRPIESRPPQSRAAEPQIEPRQWQEVEPPAPPPRRYVNPPSQQEARPDPARRPRTPAPPTLPEPRQSGSIFDQPLPLEPPPQAPSPPARHPLRRTVTERRPPMSDSGLKEFRNVISEANELGGASARAERSAREAYGAVPKPTEPERSPRAADFDRPPRSYDRSQNDRSESRMLEPHAPPARMLDPPHEPGPHEGFSEPMLESSFAVDDSRPIVPKARRGPPPPLEDDAEVEPAGREARPRRSYRNLVVKILPVVAIIVAIAGIAGLLQWQWSNMVWLYRAVRAPATEVLRDASSPASPKKTQERIEPGGQQQSVPQSTPSTQQAATVAQKVVLYEEDPADPNGKRFVGSAIWRTETVTPGPGQPPELAVRADVEVPERKLAMTWSFRRNTDKGLPATHTVEIMFKLPADFPSGGISNVPGILMKQAESTRGVPLAGLAVKVTPGFYLIGLSNLDQDKDRNLQLLKERGWFDIPVVYNNNRRAILAMEKGTPGDRAFAEAFKAWKQ
jgi:hypothetical protein